VTNRLQGVEFDRACVLGFQAGLFGNPAGSTSNMEGTHRKLSSRLTDGLRGDNSDSLTDLHEFSGCQIPAVATYASAAPGLAGQYRANLDAFNTRRLDRARQIFRNLLVDLDDHFALVILDLFERNAADNTITQRFDDFSRLHN